MQDNNIRKSLNNQQMCSGFGQFHTKIQNLAKKNILNFFSVLLFLAVTAVTVVTATPYMAYSVTGRKIRPVTPVTDNFKKGDVHE
jgi:hypothetical protein